MKIQSKALQKLPLNYFIFPFAISTKLQNLNKTSGKNIQQSFAVKDWKHSLDDFLISRTF